MENTTIQNRLKLHKVFNCVLSGFLLAMILGIIFTKKTSQNEDIGHSETVKVDSIVQTDTVYIEIPKTLIKYKEITKVESVYVEVPAIQEKILFEQKHYEDSIADIYISGFQPNIDSINYHIPKQTVYIDRTIEVEKPKSFWQDRFVFTVGVYGGYGIIHKQPDIFIGAGVGIRLGR